MLEDGVFATESWLSDAGHKAIAARMLRASFQGWIYCRDHPADCVEMVIKQRRHRGHDQAAPDDDDGRDQQVDLGAPGARARHRVYGTGVVWADGRDRAAVRVITKPAGAGAYTHAIWRWRRSPSSRNVSRSPRLPNEL